MKLLVWPVAAIIVLSVIVGVYNDFQGDAVEETTAEIPKEKTEKETTVEEPKEDEAAKIVAEYEANKKDKPKEEMVTITDFAITTAVETTKQDTLVKDAYIEAKDNRILISIIVNAATTEEQAKEIGENAARQLAAFSGYKTPTKDYLGEIYDHYELMIGVGTGPNNIMVQGAKVTASPKITW